MRTDVTIDTKSWIRLDQFSYPKNRVDRGDFIRFRRQNRVSIGRVIGSLVNPDDQQTYICVVELYLSGFLAEYWVKPADVLEVERGTRGTNLFADKAKWFFSDDFFATSVDQQRNISEILAHET